MLSAAVCTFRVLWLPQVSELAKLRATLLKYWLTRTPQPVQKLLTNSIGRAGGYNLLETRLLDEVPHFSLPCLFICASKKDFFMPSHTMTLLEKYGGPKSFVQFTGSIDDNRPVDVLETVMNHFIERLKIINGSLG